MIDELIKYLEENTSETGNWTLFANDHLGFYETAEENIAKLHDFFDFASEEQKQKCIDTNRLYYIQWYPNTPVGFNVYAAPTLEELAEYVLSFKVEATPQ